MAKAVLAEPALTSIEAPEQLTVSQKLDALLEVADVFKRFVDRGRLIEQLTVKEANA